jgi:hypothetical protein
MSDSKFDPTTAIVHFGKFEGKTWSELPTNYLDWLAVSGRGLNKEKAAAVLLERRRSPGGATSGTSRAPIVSPGGSAGALAGSGRTRSPIAQERGSEAPKTTQNGGGPVPSSPCGDAGSGAWVAPPGVQVKVGSWGPIETLVDPFTSGSSPSIGLTNAAASRDSGQPGGSSSSEIAKRRERSLELAFALFRAIMIARTSGDLDSIKKIAVDHLEAKDLNVDDSRFVHWMIEWMRKYHLWRGPIVDGIQEGETR